LQAMSDLFKIVGVANTRLESAETAAAAYGIPRAFANAGELAADPDVDIVAITVKVPYHCELAKTAILAGKHVYCEWPLGNGLAQAQEMARLAEEQGVLAVCGTQALGAPELQYAAELIGQGYVGEVLSTTITGRGRGWGAVIPLEKTGYVLDNRNGASMLTIPFGHTLAAVRSLLGDFSELSAVLASRRTEVKALDTGAMVPMTAHDQVLLAGVLASGAPVSMHYRGGDARDGQGLHWQINGSEGDLHLEGASGHAQQVAFTLKGGRGAEKEMRKMDVPAEFQQGPANALAGNVGRIYARMADDLRHGTHRAPTFADAVEVHKIIDAIERSNATGQRVKLG
jgi:predicted dehydrogenase